MKKSKYIDYNVLLACLSGRKKNTVHSVEALIKAVCNSVEETTTGIVDSYYDRNAMLHCVHELN